MQRDVTLSRYTTLGVGGPAQHFRAARSADELREALRLASDSGWPLLLLGGGSNLLIADAGFPGLVLQPVAGEIALRRDDATLWIDADAGCPWDELVRRSVEAGSAALAPLSGIPGSCGAAPIQNIGAYGVELSEHLDSVALLDRHTREESRVDAGELELSYRDSRLKSRDEGRYVVLSIRLRVPLRADLPLRYEELRRRFQEERLASTPLALRQLVLRIRRDKSMVLDADDAQSRSAGSFFTNPSVEASRAEELAASVGGRFPRWPLPDGRVKLSAAWCIERVGFRRGERRGAAALSKRHVLALCNPDGDATAAQLLGFAREIHERVHAELGIELDVEPRLVGFSVEELGPLRRRGT